MNKDITALKKEVEELRYELHDKWFETAQRVDYLAQATNNLS